MKLDNAIKKLSKYAEFKQQGQQFSAVIGRYTVTFFKNGRSDEITCMSTRRTIDKSDMMTDYFPQMYHPTLSAAIKYAIFNK